MSNQHTYVINLIGSGIRYWIYSPTDEEYTLMIDYKKLSNKSWSELFFDFDFLKQLNRNHWSELADMEKKGFLINPNNLIEIRKKNKILEKFNSVELVNQNTIFPLYQTSRESISYDKPYQFAIIQYEKGLIEKYEIKSDKLDLNQLTFNLIQNEMGELLPLHMNDINYLESKLECKMDDSLITSLCAIELI